MSFTRLYTLALVLLALAACTPAPASIPTPLAVVATATLPSSPTIVPSAAPSATIGVAPSATPDAAASGFAPASPTPELPAQTIGVDSVAALAPLRAVGVGRALQTALSRDGSLVAVATTAGVALLEAPSMRLARFDAIPGGVERVALSPDGGRMAFWRVNPTLVELRRVADGALLASAPGQSAAFSVDGALFAGGADEQAGPPNQITLWRSADGVEVATLPGADVVFSPDSKTIATMAIGDGNVGTHFARADGSEIGFVNGGWPRFSPDGSLVAVTVYPLDATTPQTGVYRTANAEPAFGVDGALPTFSANGRLLAATQGRDVLIYDAMEGKQLLRLSPGAADPAAYGETNIIALAFSADGAWLRAAVGGDLYSWGMPAGEPISQFPGATQRGGQPDATFSADGEWVISRNVVGDADCGLLTGLRVLNAANGSELAAEAQGVAAQLSDDGSAALIVTSLGTVRLVPINGSRDDIVATLPGYGAIAFSPEGAALAASQARGDLNPFGPSSVGLYDVAGGALTAAVSVDSYVGEPTSLRFSADGSTLLAEEESACDFIYDVRQTAWDLLSDRTGRTIWEVPKIASEPYPAAAFVRAFSPQSGAGAWADEQGVVRVAHNGVTTTLTLDTKATALAFSPDGALLAVADERGAVRLLDPAGSGAEAQPATAAQAEASVKRLAFSPDGTLLAAQRDDGRVLVWRTSQPQPLATLEADPDDAQLLISSDNELLVSAGLRGVSFYSLSDGRKLRTLDVVASGIAMGPGRRLLAVLSDERVILWGASPSRP